MGILSQLLFLLGLLSKKYIKFIVPEILFFLSVMFFKLSG